MPSAKSISPNRKKKDSNKQSARQLKLEPSVHRRILRFLNEAVYPEDLAYEKVTIVHGEGHLIHDHNPKEMNPKRKKILDIKIAKVILEFRNREYPLGFRNLNELFTIRRLHRNILENILKILYAHFGRMTHGQWQTLPYNTQRPGGISVDVGHAALLHNGKVLFIPADYSNDGWPTPIWDPTDEVNPIFQYPATNPDYALFCGGHSFLSDGKLLVVGGGGDRNVTPTAEWGFKFNPDTREWVRTSESMREYRWYPTALTLGDQRVIVTCGNGAGHMQAYNEATDRFEEISGTTRFFPNLYPGLHLLPNHAIFYSRTGWGSAREGPALNDNQSAFFTFSPSNRNTGSWTSIASASINRAKGMSVLILQSTPPYARVLVIGGVDSSGNGISSAEIIDVSVLSPSSTWQPPMSLPDPEQRRQCNAVLLPDGTVFVSGGIDRMNSPCALFDPRTDTWSPMDELPSIRGYHSVALLLPSGKVMAAGGDGNPRIELFSPPYLFRGPRPVISSAPTLVHHGQKFVIESPNASSIVKVVLVRPMAVTHQTDTEQKVLEMPYIYDRAHPTRLTLTAPHGGHPYSLAQQGYYMMFAVNNNGVPSAAKWIYVQPSFFSPVYSQGDPGNGIGGYDLASPADRAFAFDYDHSGKLDHMALYRPATGTMWILKNTNGSFSPVYSQGDPGNGIGGYDLMSAADRAFAFDYDHSGKLDHMALYRPATGTMWILRQQ
jgi:hypothetical protein